MGDSKYIIVCCDGTANDGTVAAPDGVDPQLTLDQFPTNVARIARSLAHRAINKQRQIVFYQKGVGTESVFNGEPGTGSTWNQIKGTTVASKIREAYTFIAQNYNDGDEIFLFGFSRGAYTARKVAGLIDRIGLLSMQNIGSFFHIWLELLHDKSPTLPPDTKSPSIKAVAVFDTVNSVYQSPIQYNDALSIKDTSFPETVAVGLHALSFHENRVHYLPTLWTIPKGGLKPNQHMKQVWFPGDHADVGGGWDRHELSDISIAWMVGELKFYYPNLAFDANRLHSFHQVNPEPWGTSKPHWSWSPAIFLDRSQTNQLTTESILHSSLLVSPTSLGFLNVQITMKKLFGDPAKYPKPMPLNDFERVCKENWGKMLHQPAETNGATWALITLPGDPVPENPVWAATDGAGKDLYVGSAEGYPGTYNGQTISTARDGKQVTYASGLHGVLVSKGLRWVHINGTLDQTKYSGLNMFHGGKSIEGDILYVARADPTGSLGVKYPGWVKIGGNAHIGYEGVEKVILDYDVLCFIPI